VLVTLCAVPACKMQISEIDGAFYDGDGRLVHCGVNLDSSANSGIDSVDAALDRARDRGEVVELYAHHPGATVPVAKIEHVLAAARDRGLAFVTYADFAHGTEVMPGLALSFDDTSIDAWFALRPLFAQYQARVTFFVSRYRFAGAERHDELRQLGADGHDIEAHSANHLRGPEYVEQHGINAYVREEVDPSIKILRDEGFPVEAFAYPFGARTSELDHAIAKRVPVLRSVAFPYEGAGGPCPR
jgi:peptidoglycan/xylan/chitin deacetylase (PgdA/CDA1 family)